MKQLTKNLCKDANHQQMYCSEFDSVYCEICDIWLEDICHDPFCVSNCGSRPAKPSLVEGGINKEDI